MAVLLTQMTSYFRVLLFASDWMSSHTSSGAPACLTAHDGRLHLAYTWKLLFPCTCQPYCYQSVSACRRSLSVRHCCLKRPSALTVLYHAAHGMAKHGMCGL